MSETSEKKYYCFCGSNCKYETLTKEQILAAIAQAVETGTVGDCDAGFITKLKENNSGNYVSVWVGTKAQYNALPRVENNCLYIITDDTSAADLLATVQQQADFAQQAAEDAAASAAAATLGSVVEIKANDMGEYYKLYGNGMAEACDRLRWQNVNFNNNVGGLYLSSKLHFPFASWLTSKMYYDEAPLSCQVFVEGISDEDAPVFVLTCGTAEKTRSANFQLACTKQTTQDVRLRAHVTFWWKKVADDVFGDL